MTDDMNLGFSRSQIDTPTFLMVLSDRLHDLSRPLEMIDVVLGMIGNYLNVDRAGFVEIEHDSDMIHYAVGWGNGVLEPLSGRQSIAEQLGPRYIEHYRAGRTSYAQDTDDDPLGIPGALSSVGAKAMMAVPLLRNGDWVAGLFVNQATVRNWLPSEGALLEGAVRHLWNAIERARVDFVLAETTAERDVFWRHSRDLFGTVGGDGIWDSVNPAWTKLLGWNAKDVVGQPLAWLEMEEAGVCFEKAMSSLRRDGDTIEVNCVIRNNEHKPLKSIWNIELVGGKVYCIGHIDRG